jgi:glycerophosphoryl diester phosphodiesterase
MRGANTRPLRLAHRGDWRVAPENTLEALLASLRIPGCDGVEFDVRMNADGFPVILHDETLARVHGHPGHAAGMRAAELAALGVPSLASVLEALPGAFLDVELKGADHGRATAGVLQAARGASGERAVVSSFEPRALAAMADRLPGWERWLNAMDLSAATMTLALGLGCTGISVLWGALTPARIRDAQAAGLDVAAWTVRYRATFERLGRLGVVACCVEGAALDG